MTDKARALIDEAESKKQPLSETMYNLLERDAKRNWDLFYKANKTNFYKDRNYIKHEFKELSEAKPPFLLLDAGCGVGNGFYPLFREFGMRVHCCDFSPRAVDFVKQNELYKADLIDAQVCDLVKDPALPFALETADFGLFLFVLSAISPENHPAVAVKIYQQMKPGGILYFRDYGRYDLAQLRLAQRPTT